MLCEKCFKNEATVRYEQKINGEGTKLNLCHECAEKMGVLKLSNVGNIMEDMMGDFINDFMWEPFENIMPNHILNELIPVFKYNCGLRNSDSIRRSKLNNITKGEKCPRCGYTRDYYINNGKGGCPECYGSFETEKKVKSVNNSETEIKKLEAQLEKCIKTENYEEAAKIRDMIKKIKEERE